MQYDFSAQFLKGEPPDTAHPQAWEALCAELLSAEFGYTNFDRLAAPDHGIDIISRPLKEAYQCKSSIHGTYSTIPSGESEKSLRQAFRYRDAYSWKDYLFATNALYTAPAMEKIVRLARALGLPDKSLHFRGPDYWDKLCVKHADLIRGRFDYRVTASQKSLLEALELAQSSLGKRRAARLTRMFEREASKHREYVASIKNLITELDLELALPDDMSSTDLAILYAAVLQLRIKRAHPWLTLDEDYEFNLKTRFNGEEIEDARLGDLALESGGKLEFIVEFNIGGRALSEAESREDVEAREVIQRQIWAGAHHLKRLESEREKKAA